MYLCIICSFICLSFILNIYVLGVRAGCRYFSSVMVTFGRVSGFRNAVLRELQVRHRDLVLVVLTFMYLFIVHNYLIAYCLLLTVYHMLCIVYCVSFTVYCLSCIVYCSLFPSLSIFFFH